MSRKPTGAVQALDGGTRVLDFGLVCVPVRSALDASFSGGGFGVGL
jgi:hypothetical protein